MAILEKEVWVTLHSRNVSHFEKLNYKIQRKYNGHRMVVPRGTKIKVKVEDLLNTSMVEITRICDFCGNQKKIPYKKIMQCRENSIGEKDCCANCLGLKSFESRIVPTGQSLAEKFPEIAVEWHPALNKKKPLEVYYSSNKEYWWICPMNPEHIYNMPIGRRTISGCSCPYCSNHRIDHTNCLATVHPELTNEWNWEKNSNLTPFMFSSGSTEKVWWICSECNYEWFTKINSRTNKSTLSGCPECGKRIMAEKIKGENHYNWQGGISSIRSYLRQRLTPWKIDSLKNSQYKCVLTERKGTLEVHHLYGFEMIIKETFKETNIEIKSNISDYTDEELKLLEEKCLEIHYRYPLGIALTKEIHRLFHHIYGITENTPSQFEEFKLRWHMGEFNDLLFKDAI